MPRGADPSRWAPSALVVVALVLGVGSLPRVEREVADESRRSAVAVVAGVPSIPGQPAGTQELIRRLRREVPRREAVRLVTAAGVCGALPIRRGQGVVFWLQYHMLPRTFTCDPGARWTLYLGVPPGPEAAGARETISLPPTFTVVRTR